MWASKPYNFIRSGSKKMLAKLPPALKAVHRAEEYMKGMVSPGTLFEEIGFNYIGLVDGHDTEGLVEILSNIKSAARTAAFPRRNAEGQGLYRIRERPLRHARPQQDYACEYRA